MGEQAHHPAQERRQMLIDAAVRVMRRKGLLETTGRDVAKEAGTSVGLVHHYFASQDALLVAAFEQVAVADIDRVRRLVGAEPVGVPALRALLRHFAPARTSWQYRVWIDAWAASAHHPDLRRSSRAVNLRWQKVFSDVFREGVATGAFRCPEPDASAWRLLALLDGMAVQTTAGQTATPRRVLAGWVTSAAAMEAGVAADSLL